MSAMKKIKQGDVTQSDWVERIRNAESSCGSII